MTRSPLAWAFLALLLSVCGPAAPCRAAAAPPGVGDPAPEIGVRKWLNVAAGQEPTPESLKGRVVMIEFWGTWCGPCVQAMPKVQEIHDRYKDRGLTVLAISYETLDVMRPFLEKNAYTMPVGSDPAKATVEAYGVRSWPSTFVIDRDGKIAFAGAPYGVEPAIEKALGLESSPGTLLTAWLSLPAKADAAAARAALERLVEKAPSDFDLRAWALALGGKPPEDAKAPAKVDPAELLEQCAKAKGDAAKREPALRALALAGPQAFDLAAWARKVFARECPVTPKEIDALLAAGKYLDVLDALLDRRPQAPSLAAAARHQGLADFSAKKAAEHHTFARKGVMILHWVLPGKVPKDNDAFWSDLSVSGISTSPDQKKVVGVLVGGDMLTEAPLPAWIDRQLGRSLLMEDFASKDVPNLSKVAGEVAKRRERILKELKTKYE